VALALTATLCDKKVHKWEMKDKAAEMENKEET